MKKFAVDGMKKDFFRVAKGEGKIEFHYTPR